MFAHRWFAPLLVILSALASYTGAAFAVDLFAQITTPSVAWARFAVAAIILCAWRRPWRGRSLRSYVPPVIFGVVIAVLTLLFYASISMIPMGASVAIQFLGPVTLAMVAGRSWRIRASVLVALVGVFMISFAGLDVREPGIALGILVTLAAGTMWAMYIVAGRHMGPSGHPLDNLAIATAVAAVVTVPFAPGAAAIVFSPALIGSIIIVALLSNIVTYALDIVVMPHVSAPMYSLLSALSPATSLAVGVLMLGQRPSLGEFVGLVIVMVAVALPALGARPGDVVAEVSAEASTDVDPVEALTDSHIIPAASGAHISLVPVREPRLRRAIASLSRLRPGARRALRARGARSASATTPTSARKGALPR
ncbi:inner membrane transporter RhtA [Arcanobacterium wilhelmae]|uniref:Inner membrane transporter RhtA n=1 Tax=Arcanobacterium wilhelmae TaxID=1803177 RepID=A0ABT9NBG6_9ACTO|nr:EamA family transporter [Arcanobacterium wilhelmae]MDP9801041.1 inner membrane transporter RhtA [Arcanobacterium wilhelmae]WFN90398.1 EamA family transporter [Arcanobacterium wilhelmae]